MEIPNYLTMEKIQEKIVIYQLGTNRQANSNTFLFICDQIQENLFTNIKIIEANRETYKSQCVANLRTNLTLAELQTYVINTNLDQEKLKFLINLQSGEPIIDWEIRHSKIEHLSEKYLIDVINFLERKPTEKEVNYLIKKENKNIENLEKLLELPRWKMHLAIHCSSMFADPSELKDFVYTSKGEIKELGYRPKYISDKYVQILHNTYGQLANDYESHLDKKKVLQGEKEITEETKLYILKNLEKKSVKEFCENTRKKYANIETGYLQQNLCIPLVIKKEFEFMSNEEKVKKLSS